MLPLKQEIERKLSHIASSMPAYQRAEEQVIAIENIANLIGTIETNYSEKNYETFKKDQKINSCLYELQTELTSTSKNLALEVTQKAAILASKIQSILMRTSFINLISILPTETIIKYIIPFMSTSQNKYTFASLPGKEHRAFACTSKKNNELVKKTNEEWSIEHVAIQAQQSDVESKEFKNCEEAIAYTIEKGYAIVDLRGFKDVTDEIIEKLFKDYPNLNHFMVNSDEITKLPDCSQLQTLICNGCTGLAALPADMVNLVELNCCGCTALKALPSGMVNLAKLDCSGCIGLAALPADMVKLSQLNCCGCTALKALPSGMVNLVKLDCSGCIGLAALPADMVNLSQLYCRGCTGLQALPVGMVNLSELDCSYCMALRSLPTGIVSLAWLNCIGCTSLTTLPTGMVNLAKLYCNGCTSLTALAGGMLNLAKLTCYGCTALKDFPKDIPASCGITR